MRKREKTEGILFCLPAFLILGSIVVYPLIRVVWMSFNEVSLFHPNVTNFVGVNNFLNVTRDPEFFSSLLRTFIWTGGSVSLQLVVGLGVSLLLNERIRGRNIARVLVLSPYIIPAVVAVLVWSYMFNDMFGIVSWVLMKWNLINSPIVWFGHPATAMIGLIVIGVWKHFPFVVICLLASLQSIPNELYEAGEVDGAGRWCKLTRITLPLLLPTIVVVLILRTVWVFNKFDLIYMTTGGGPINATTTLPLLIYKEAFGYFDLGAASALGTYTIVILATIVFFYLQYYKRY